MQSKMIYACINVKLKKVSTRYTLSYIRIPDKYSKHPDKCDRSPTIRYTFTHSSTVYNSLIHFTNACNTLRTQPVGYSQWQRHQFNLKCRLRYSKYRNNTFWWPNFNIWLEILHRYTRDRCHDTLWIVRFFLHSIWFFLLIRKGVWFHWNGLDFQGFF